MRKLLKFDILEFFSSDICIVNKTLDESSRENWNKTQYFKDIYVYVYIS